MKLTQDQWDEMYGQIEPPEVRRAFCFIISWFCLRGHLTIEPNIGSVRTDVHFGFDDGRRPYALIRNKSSLLWYFRKPCLDDLIPSNVILGAFPDAQTNNKGEVTLRINGEREADHLVRWIAQVGG